MVCWMKVTCSVLMFCWCSPGCCVGSTLSSAYRYFGSSNGACIVPLHGLRSAIRHALRTLTSCRSFMPVRRTLYKYSLFTFLFFAVTFSWMLLVYLFFKVFFLVVWIRIFVKINDFSHLSSKFLRGFLGRTSSQRTFSFYFLHLSVHPSIHPYFAK